MSNGTLLALLSSVLGGTLVAVVNHLLARDRMRAESKKLNAEADKIIAETTQLMAGVEPESDALLVVHHPPAGWGIAGTQPELYSVQLEPGRDPKTHTVLISSSTEATNRGFVTVMQQCNASAFESRRVQLTGVAKTEGVEGFVGFWVRIDNRHGDMVAFDNMGDRPIVRTTPWETYRVVVDIPDDGSLVSYGVILNGRGKVWVDSIDVVSASDTVPLTGKVYSVRDRGLHRHPVNGEFADTET